MIGIYEIPERVVDGNLIPLKYVVEWGWYVLVRNKSERTKKIDISYHLLDKDGFEISNSIKIDNWVYGLNPNRKKPESYLDFDSLTFLGNKNIIQGTGTFDYKYLDRIGKSKYEIKLTY